MFKASRYKKDKPYVSWSAEGRDFISANCYGPRKEVSDAVSLEISALKKAMSHQIKNDRALALQSVRQFLAARHARYELLKDAKFHPETWDAPETCADGEAEMEDLEGTPSFIEVVYLSGINALTIDQWISRAEASHNDWYYRLGSLQLMLLYKLDPKFAELDSQIQKGGEPPGISLYTTALKKLVSISQAH